MLAGRVWLPVDMATSETKQGKGYTAPKGRPTVHNTGQATGRRMSSTMQWTLVIVVFLIVMAVIFYVGRDFRGLGPGDVGYTGSPATAPMIDGSLLQVRAAAASFGVGVL